MDKVKTLFELIKDKQFDKFLKFLKENEDIDVNIRDENDNYLINFGNRSYKKILPKFLYKLNKRQLRLFLEYFYCLIRTQQLHGNR